MKTKAIIAIILIVAAACFVLIEETMQKSNVSINGTQQVFFCPEDSCAKQLIQRIDAAKSSIHIAVYSFTSQEIADAIIRAKNRGVEIKIITDYVQAAGQYSKDEFLREKGIEIRIKKIASGSMHNKFAIIDNETVATGSFNYTENANEKNDENLIFLDSIETAKLFETEFQEIWQTANS
jgi:phosphatidylserine/phosphatidylglycerophosphate/cardiolipin synthase-like enzyme